ncbi:hypothetical protein [Dyadobacter tibetensis]|uniref:hypothetical protein n=1 Tax=Dyadobacter tibetensis TaxID=1211851 RepID=UPI0004724B0A|nr:hypothetical protein [Dyadobacter tibetensis]
MITSFDSTIPIDLIGMVYYGKGFHCKNIGTIFTFIYPANMLQPFKRILGASLFLWYFGCHPNTYCLAQSRVTVDFTTKRSIDGYTFLDRNAYFNMHHGIPDTEFTDKEREFLYKELRIGNGGRSFSGVGGLGHQLTQLPTDAMMRESGKSSLEKVKDGIKSDGQLIVTEHPRMVFNAEVPLDSLAAFATRYFKYYYGVSRPLPQFYEPMNEPFVHAREFGKDPLAIIEKMSNYHAILGQMLHQHVPNLKVVGYSSAWPEYDLHDFEIWNTRMKKFMDIAGAEMDYLSIHLYDGVNLAGEVAKRSGSNSEAILDLIESYSYIKWNKVKPMLISEFGITGKGWSDVYKEERLPLTINSMHNLVMGFMERPEVIKLSIPFITGKSKWRLSAGNTIPYQWCISRPSKTDPSGWEFTALTQFYDFWKNVEGERVAITSSDPDLATQAFIKDKKAFIIIKNLEQEDSRVNLSSITGPMQVKSIVQKSWSINPDSSILYTVGKIESIPDYLDLPSEGAVLFEIEHKAKASSVTRNILSEKKFYAREYIKPIIEGNPLTFNIASDDTTSNLAEIRLSIARQLGRSLQPYVEVNGVSQVVPDDWAGYDQASRHGYFGTLIIPVKGTGIKKNNTVTVRFDDADGGRVSSVVLKAVKIKKQ